MLRKLGNYFLAGLLALLPLVITVALVGFVYAKLVSWLGPSSPFGQFMLSLADVTALPPLATYLLTFALVVLVVLGLGSLASRYTGQRIISFFNSLIGRIPFINKVYSSTEQVVQLFNSSSGDSVSALSDVVCARIANTYVLGMLANNQPVRIGDKDYFFFYMPNTPVPATGNLYMIPREDIYNVDVSVEELTRIEVSLGSLGPSVINSRKQPEEPAIAS